MNKKIIQECNNINKLKNICMAQYHQLAVISTYIVQFGKGEITAETTCDRIGEYLVKNQFEVEI